MYIGPKLKNLYLEKMLATAFIYISLESIYQVLKDNLHLDWIYQFPIGKKISEKSEKLEFFVGGPKMYIFEK